MKTLKTKIRNILKDFIFNSIMVKPDIVWVKEKNKVDKKTKTTYKKFIRKSI